MDKPVTEALCKARTETMTTKLDAIAQDAALSREVGGKIMRRLFEGNGVEALDVQIQRNTEYRVREADRAEARRRFEWARKLGWATAGMGWLVAVLLWWLSQTL